MPLNKLPISIVVPLFNEAERIDKFLKQIQKLNFQQVILVDGNSTDLTVAKAEGFNVKIVSSPKMQRSFQMNLGSSYAQSGYLLFLHADVDLPINFDACVKKAIAENIELANFKLKFDLQHWFLKLNQFFTHFKSSWFQFGDQGLLIKRSLFESIEGYDEKKDLAEGNDLIRRARRHARFYKLNATLVASARKYQMYGVIRLQFTYYVVYLLLRLGVAQKRVISLYQKLIK